MSKKRTSAVAIVTALVMLALAGVLVGGLPGCAARQAAPRPAQPPAPSPTPAPPVVQAAPGQPPVTPPRLSAVAFLNSQTGWLAGHDAEPGAGHPVLLGTQDGGRAWSGLTVPGSHVLQLKFTDATHGWAVSGTNPRNYIWSNLALFSTADSGKIWTRRWEGPWPKSLENITLLMRVRIQFFGNDGAVLAGGNLLTTSDGGNTWRPASFPSSGFIPVDTAFVDGKTGWVAGQQADPTSSGGAKPLVLATRDGGKTWTRSFSAPKATPYWAYSSSIAFVDRQSGWLHFKGDDLRGFMYRTTDGGRTWAPLPVPGELTGRTVAGTPTFVDAKVGWLPVSGGASPFPGVILITQDGGRTWHKANTGEEFSAGALSPVSPKEAWVITDRPTPHNQELLLHTTDEGQTWQQVLPQPTVAQTPAGQ